MDIRMPGLDGLTATRHIRAGAQDTVIIAVSASAFEYNRARCLEAGADDFLPKPFRQGKLLELLSQHLGLTLRYLTDGELSPGPSRQPPSDLTLPPAEQLRVLLDLARRGDIQSLLREANHLEGLGEAYKPFAGQLRTLAEAYEVKKLRHWLITLGGAP
ncbi:MAG: response regulator [Gammaproteobacteria bacterium]